MIKDDALAVPNISSLVSGVAMPIPTLPAPLGMIEKCSSVPVMMSLVIPEKVTDPVVKVGALLKTKRPEPVSSEIDRAVLAEEMVLVN